MAQVMLQRMVWNTQGWWRPSGATTDAGYAARTGFGHEEWNFQTDDHLNGELLGYINFQPSDRVIDNSGNSFDVGFFTIDARSKSRWLVGTWRGARRATSEEIQAFDAHFERHGIYERRASELLNAVPTKTRTLARKEVREAVKKEWMRFIVPTGGVRAFAREEWVALPNDMSVGLHFNTPTFVDRLPNGGKPKTLRSAAGTKPVRSTNNSTTPLVADGYLREIGGGLTFIEREHAELSNQLVAWLKRQKCRAIRQEESQVDVGFERDGRSYLAEIKICGSLSTRHAIREAMGQLLEYNHYGWRNAADRWWIVLDRKPSQSDRDYIKCLRQCYSFSLCLGWCSGNEFAFDEAAFL